jgi:hypothetical protein
MSRRTSLRQLTIRGFEPEVEAHIRDLARRERLSLNQAVMRLLRRAAGGGDGTRREADCVGSSLDHLAGTWSAEDERQFTEAIAPLERVDPDFWGKRSKPARRRA